MDHIRICKDIRIMRRMRGLQPIIGAPKPGAWTKWWHQLEIQNHLISIQLTRISLSIWMTQPSNQSRERTVTLQTRLTLQASLQRQLELITPKIMHFIAPSIKVLEKELQVVHSSHQQTTVFKAEMLLQTTTWRVMASAATMMSKAKEYLKARAKETEGNRCTLSKIPLISQDTRKLQEAVSDQSKRQDPAILTSNNSRLW